MPGEKRSAGKAALAAHRTQSDPSSAPQHPPASVDRRVQSLYLPFDIVADKRQGASLGARFGVEQSLSAYGPLLMPDDLKPSWPAT